VYVHSDTHVNLLVLDHVGNALPRENVAHKQDAVCGDMGCWSWMPYQLGQAAKAEAVVAEAQKPSGLMERMASLEARVDNVEGRVIYLGNRP
jgi:hypothetical protein